MKVIILGAGYPHFGKKNAALSQVSSSKLLIDWHLSQLSKLADEVTFISGFKSDDLSLLNAVNLNIVVNKFWNRGGPAGSLSMVKIDPSDDLLIVYGDTLYRSRLVEDMMTSHNISIVVDSYKNARLPGLPVTYLADCEKIKVCKDMIVHYGRDLDVRSADIFEFLGLVFIPKRYTESFATFITNFLSPTDRRNLSQIMFEFTQQCVSLPVSLVDSFGDVSQIKEKSDIRSFLLGTKGETLVNLSKVITKSVIPKSQLVGFQDWVTVRTETIASCQRALSARDCKLAVRSSASSEDSFLASNAGKYHSVLNIDSLDSLTTAIDTVFASYPEQKGEHVLVQPMVSGVQASGVAFSNVLGTKIPWYVVEISIGDDTTQVTGGKSQELETWYIFNQLDRHYLNKHLWFSKTIEAMREIEMVLANANLDIEFALDKENTVHLLQVRPLVTGDRCPTKTIDLIKLELERCILEYEKLSQEYPNNNTLRIASILGVMPDWNPAEMIGLFPSQFSYSLYKYLITDDTWATQRQECGYQNVKQPLMLMLGGRPFIDAIASMKSFIPDNVSASLKNKLIMAYAAKLRSQPQLHDKIEFDVVISFLTPSYSTKISRLMDQYSEVSFSEREKNQLKTALHEITCNIFFNIDRNLEIVQEYYDSMHKNLYEVFENQDDFKKRLNDCKNHGVLPFAHLARAAFVSVAILKDFNELGYLSTEAFDEFFNSLNTVSKELSIDIRKAKRGELSSNELISKYGHLRPGTYDICSLTYKECPADYVLPLVRSSVEIDQSEIRGVWDQEKHIVLEYLCDLLDFDDAKKAEALLRKAIEGRELAKFFFSKGLSSIIDQVAKQAEKKGLKRAEVQHIDIINSSLFDDESDSHLLMDRIDSEIERRDLNSLIYLPQLITSKENFYYAKSNPNSPNFVGQRIVSGLAVVIDNSDPGNRPLIDGAIVLIEGADPGYDYIFGFNINGLITSFGGANSHMAIRAAEHGVSAAIGIGSEQFSLAICSRSIQIDPINKKLDYH